MKEHRLKTLPHMFDAVRDGIKSFEIRRNDRGFQAGDILFLRKYDPTHRGYLDDEPLVRRVTYVLNGFGLDAGFVVMGTTDASAPEDDGEARYVAVNIRVSKSEHARMLKAAGSMPMSAWVRNAISRLLEVEL